MRSVNLRDGVLYPTCRELGIDPTKDLIKERAAELIGFIQNWSDDGWEAWPWPELNLTEERAFRRVWYNDEAYVRKNISNFNLPDEVYYLPNQTYYQVLPTALADPPIGTLPTVGAYFSALTEYDHYLEYDQPGKQAIGVVRGVYTADPSTRIGRALGHEPSDNGIEIYGTGIGPTVWVRFQVRPSKFTAVAYDNVKAYVRGNLVYDIVTGECYRALGNTTGNAPPNANLWQIQPMPEVLAKYVIYSAAADGAEDGQTKADLRGKAERAFQRQTDKIFEQGADFPRYRVRAGLASNRRLLPGTAIVTIPA